MSEEHPHLPSPPPDPNAHRRLQTPPAAACALVMGGQAEGIATLVVTFMERAVGKVLLAGSSRRCDWLVQHRAMQAWCASAAAHPAMAVALQSK